MGVLWIPQSFSTEPSPQKSPTSFGPHQHICWCQWVHIFSWVHAHSTPTVAGFQVGEVKKIFTLGPVEVWVCTESVHSSSQFCPQAKIAFFHINKEQKSSCQQLIFAILKGTSLAYLFWHFHALSANKTTNNFLKNAVAIVVSLFVHFVTVTICLVMQGCRVKGLAPSLCLKCKFPHFSPTRPKPSNEQCAQTHEEKLEDLPYSSLWHPKSPKMHFLQWRCGTNPSEWVRHYKLYSVPPKWCFETHVVKQNMSSRAPVGSGKKRKQSSTSH